MAMSRSLGGRSFTTRLPIVIVPAVMSSRPAMDRSAVDLPHPDGPTSTMNSPSLMFRLSPSTPFDPAGVDLVHLVQDDLRHECPPLPVRSISARSVSRQPGGCYRPDPHVTGA